MWFSENILDWDEIRGGESGEVVLNIAVPQSVAEKHLHHLSDSNGGIYTIPANVVNQYRSTFGVAEVDLGLFSTEAEQPLFCKLC